ncbi:MAG: class I SAM-dependent methyltransferase [Syntrophaceae bacterium]
MAMITQNLFSDDDIRKTYEVVPDHKFTRDVITNYSTNQNDIRDVALGGLDLKNCVKVLELGCGYGHFTERLAGRLADGAHITGMDLLEGNRVGFMATLERAGFQGSFIKSGAEMIRDYPMQSFDLVIASYSLYFFPYLISEIARVLKPEGIFITITHSKFSLKEITRLIPHSLKTIGLASPKVIAINRLFLSFSQEEGQSKLAPFFQTIEMIRYPNAMIFPSEKIIDCINYISKKRFLLFKDITRQYPDKIDDVQLQIFQQVNILARNKGSFTVTKDDAVFRCRAPLAGAAAMLAAGVSA